jgi:RimK family alpha-L-glutamate ligase
LWAKTWIQVLQKLEYFSKKWAYILNSPYAIHEVWDKEIFYQKAEKLWYCIPNTWNLAKYLQKNNGVFFPCVVKMRKSMKGEWVFLLRNWEDFHKFCESFWHFWFENFLIQEYIESSHGKDLRILMLWDEVLYAMKRVSQNWDFRANIWVWGKGEEYLLDENMKKMCQKIMKDFDLDFAGIDFLFWENGFLICEVNSSPWFEEWEKVSWKDISEEVLKYIVKKAQKK